MAVLVAAILFSGCAPGAEPGAEPALLESEDIVGGPTSAMTAEGDLTAQRGEASDALIGVLPEGVPSDLPIYRPSSLVDFGGGASMGVPGWVKLHSPDGAEKVTSQLRAALDASGWRNQGDPWVRRKGDRTVRISIRSLGSGSEIEIAY
jgi:hypothetical protein